MMQPYHYLFYPYVDVNVVKSEFYFVLLAYFFSVRTNHILRSRIYSRRMGKRY